MRFACLDSPVGRLLVAGDGEGLRTILFAAGKGPCRPAAGWVEDAEPLDLALRQLEEYFAGERREFDLLLAPRGTPFQIRVWEELHRIPYGETVSYGELAERIGQPEAVRAVGSANGSNPLPIVVPCHRVIGADGSLTGYGGGVDVKRALLDLERGARRLPLGPGGPPARRQAEGRDR